MHYLHHRIRCRPLKWESAAHVIAKDSRKEIAERGGVLYGLWRNQIGRPRDEITAITVWPSANDGDAARKLFAGVPDLVSQTTDDMAPTLRPVSPEPPRRQGNFAFRWFETPPAHWDEFLELCAGAWPDFESSYDSQIIGLWRLAEPAADGAIRSLLMTRRPDLAMWERSKLPANAVETEVRRKLSRRYDLCTDTHVYTTTLLTAEDRADTARWA